MGKLKENANNKRRGISLITLIISIIIVIIVSITVMMNITKNKKVKIDIATLKSDMQAMLDSYNVLYHNELYEVIGDSSRIDDSEFKNVIPIKYKDVFSASKSGIIYSGDNADTINLCNEMGIIAIYDKNCINIGNVIIEKFEDAFEVSVDLSEYDTDIKEYVYYISYDIGKTWEFVKSPSNNKKIEYAQGCTSYIVMVEAKDIDGKKLKSNLYSINID